MSFKETAKTITFHNHLVKYRIQKRKEISRVLQRLVVTEKRSLGEIAFILCSDEFLLEMNQQHLKHDYLTDVITFDYSESQDDRDVNGEIYISIDRVKENAKTFGVNIENELHRVMIHGVLHLCGYKDHTKLEKSRMTAKEDYYLSLF
jgi:rRNA maturation RNase YbeY